MKIFNRLISSFLLILPLAITTGCAAGAATAGYAIKSQSADSLTAVAENRIVERTKREVLAEISERSNCVKNQDSTSPPSL